MPTEFIVPVVTRDGSLSVELCKECEQVVFPPIASLVLVTNAIHQQVQKILVRPEGGLQVHVVTEALLVANRHEGETVVNEAVLHNGWTLHGD